ncbi:MAG: hypothetical protein IPP32_02465 [Bacteroidetes bacterium]|nr:hypothetical protein [Bacteroidota bacterium]
MNYYFKIHCTTFPFQKNLFHAYIEQQQTRYENYEWIAAHLRYISTVKSIQQKINTNN